MRRELALAGVVTGVAGIIASQATVWALQADDAPVVAVASAVRDGTPGALAHKLIKLVGHADKPLLITGTSVLLVALCAAIGVLAARKPMLADLSYLALGVVGFLAIHRLHDADTGSYAGLIVGLGTWLVVSRLLVDPLTRPPGEDADPDVAAGASRRSFLIRSAGVLVVASVSGGLARLSSQTRRRVEQARKLLRLPVHAGVVPAGADLGEPGIAPWATTNDDFYLIHTVFTPPSIAPESWRLRIHGMVDREITLTYDDLLARAITEDWVTLCCVSNEVGGNLIGNAYWSGVLIREILAQAGPQAGADAVLQTSFDGWTCGTPLAALTDPHRNAMLAIGMNGQPLPIEHGFPVRMVVPGLYGFVSATKWLVDLEVTRFDRFTAYWTQRGWSAQGPVKTESRIDVPQAGGNVTAGTTRVGGSAWAQHTGIEKVEFQLDGGPWQTARLGTVPGIDTWVQWDGQVEVAAGQHMLVVRATDRSGYTQTSVQTDVAPNGATGWHTVPFQAS
jgi:DMSO/TMAO reductase YedYZ molybdopterin-dependent catalytic subunit